MLSCYFLPFLSLPNFDSLHFLSLVFYFSINLCYLNFDVFVLTFLHPLLSVSHLYSHFFILTSFYHLLSLSLILLLMAVCFFHIFLHSTPHFVISYLSLFFHYCIYLFLHVSQINSHLSLISFFPLFFPRLFWVYFIIILSLASVFHSVFHFFLLLS